LPHRALPVRTRAAALAGRAVAGASRRLGAGGGSVIGGRVMLVIDPGALPRLAHDRVVALVTGTNGKTTTTRLLTAALRTGGPVTTNAAGANLVSGLVSALGRDRAGATAVLEVDEGLLPTVVEAVRPAVAVLLNLSRDQLDRIGEVRMHAQRWRRALERSGGTAVVANADDPLVTWAALGSPRTTWVGTGQRWRLDAASCPQCGGRIIWDAPVPGGWTCAACDLRRPETSLRLDGDVLELPDGRRLPVRLTLPGWANRANAAMAVAGALAIGVDADTALHAMAGVADVEGRYQTVTVGDVRARLLLAKNPAGWAEALDLLRPPPTPVVVGINARIQDGRDPSWLWDVPFERLRDRFVVAAGRRGRDLAVRLHYAEVEHTFVPDELDAIRVAAARSATREVDVAANYSSFQDFRKAVGAHGREKAGTVGR
jgi:UDP-N-acetylmuramyl tripeptide synthase